MGNGSTMSADELREHMQALNVDHETLAGWLGVNVRSIQRYTDDERSDSNRRVPPALAVLMRLLRRNPGLTDVVSEITGVRTKKQRAVPQQEQQEEKEER